MPSQPKTSSTLGTGMPGGMASLPSPSDGTSAHQPARVFSEGLEPVVGAWGCAARALPPPTKHLACVERASAARPYASAQSGCAIMCGKGSQPPFSYWHLCAVPRRCHPSRPRQEARHLRVRLFYLQQVGPHPSRARVFAGPRRMDAPRRRRCGSQANEDALSEEPRSTPPPARPPGGTRFRAASRTGRRASRSAWRCSVRRRCARGRWRRPARACRRAI